MNPPLFNVLIGKEVFELYIEETFSTKEDGRGGVLFRTLVTGKKFFCPFEKFSIVS
jgi:hypothetical protein